MVIVAQLVRASDCGSEGRGFETRLSPKIAKLRGNSRLFLWIKFVLFLDKFLRQYCYFPKKVLNCELN